MATTEETQGVPKQVERKAAAKEDIINTTSGARETVEHSVINARAVGKILMNPFNKEHRADAINTAREEKAASGQKMAAIRGIGAQQADSMRASSKGMVPPPNAMEGAHDPAQDLASAETPAAPPATPEDREAL